MTEAAFLEKQELEQKLEEARTESDLLKQQFADEKNVLKEELEKLRDEKTELLKIRDGLVELKDKLNEDIQVLQDKLTSSEQAVERAQNNMEKYRLQVSSLRETIRILHLNADQYNIEIQGKDDIIKQDFLDKANLERTVEDLRDELQGKTEHYKLLLRELRYEKEVMQKEIDECKKRLEAKSDEDTPVNFFKQDNEAASSVLMFF